MFTQYAMQSFFSAVTTVAVYLDDFDPQPQYSITLSLVNVQTSKTQQLLNISVRLCLVQCTPALREIPFHDEQLKVWVL